MKSAIILFFSSLLLFGCKKTTTNEITYEVTLVNSTTWHGSYLNERAEVVGITDAPSGWKHTFKNTNNLAVAQLNAYPDGIDDSIDAIMTIYVNGKIVASGLSSVFAQVQYIFP